MNTDSTLTTMANSSHAGFQLQYTAIIVTTTVRQSSLTAAVPVDHASVDGCHDHLAHSIWRIHLHKKCAISRAVAMNGVLSGFQ